MTIEMVVSHASSGASRPRYLRPTELVAGARLEFDLERGKKRK